MSTLLCRFSAVLFLLVLWIDYIGTKEVRIVCYYTNWSVYRPGDAKFNPQNINPYLCTHLVYAFGGFTKENTLKPFDKYQDVEKGGYAKFVGLKTYNKNLKTLLAIGGWNEGSTRFSPMVANADRRKELVKNTIKFLRQNHFDGLDLDWEYPSFRDGGKARDKDNYAQLVQELREEFERESEKTGRPRLLLTMAVPAGIEYIKKGYDIPKLTKYLDWMNILSYDYHSAYEPAVNHHSPLYPTEEESEYSYDIDLNIDYTIKHYVESGADKSKLVLGIPTYGRSYTLYNPDANEIGAPADGPGDMGEATRENGYLAYYEICHNIKSEGWLVENPYPDVMGPYAYKNDQWVSYDDEEIARKKSEYVAENGLGGIMFWSIDNDDFRGNCGQRSYPIIEAAKEALLKAYGLTDSSLLATTKKPIKSRTRTRTRGTTKTIGTTESSVVINSGGRQSSRRRPHRISSSKGEVKPSSSSPSRRRRPSIKKKTKPETRENYTEGSSLLVTPSYTTPAPPSTPETGGEFKCEEEGFFPHPRECKKYFWCLSGPSELGIIAHQFTCPAGLYFNKAASSCDYTQNVLCNKKISKSSTTTTTTATPSTSTNTVTAASIFSTRRPPPKITAATSRTTSTTAEPEYEEEYEYYDEDENENTAKDSEEDPRVIKELIELIKKAGGIEELEKQLKLQEDGSATVASPGSTTQSSISKSLYQRVLSKATATLRENANSKDKTLRYNFLNRNSRGPQNQGISQDNEETSRSNKLRPQYTSILRSRSSTEATVNESDDVEDNEKEGNEDGDDENLTDEKRKTSYRKSLPEYVTIRRQRPSTTTAETIQTEDEEPEKKNLRSPFKQLGEEGGDEIEDTEENDKIVRNTLKSSTTPSPYVTIRRSRPTTTGTEAIESSSEGSPNLEITSTESTKGSSSTSGLEYITILRQRPSTEEDVTTSRYIATRTRGTTTAGFTTVSESENTEIPQTTVRSRSTTTTTEKEIIPTTILSDNSEKVKNETNSQVETSNLVEENTVETSNNPVTEIAKPDDEEVNVEDVVNNVKQIIKTEKENGDVTTTTSTESVISNETIEKKRPQGFEPRPFSFSLRRTTTPTTTTTKTPTTTPQENKVSFTSPRSLFRKKAFGARDSLLNRNKENKLDSNGNKENSVIDYEIKAQYDDSENQLAARKRFRNSVSSDKISENSYDKDEQTKDDRDNTEYRIRLRNRGRSRFTLQTIGTTASPRPRIRLVTDDPDVDYETTEYIRKYRPDISYEISDLSSLTAVDLKDRALNRRNGFGRRRRPTTQTTEATAPSTTEKVAESLKTGSRTIPLARKFLEKSSFGKSRRIRPTTIATPSTIEGSITPFTNNEAQATEKRFISKLRRPINRVEVENTTSTVAETSTEKSISKLPRFRKFGISTTIAPISEQSASTANTDFSSSVSTRKPLLTRRRKILRRLRVSTQRPNATTTTELAIPSSTEKVTSPSLASTTSTIGIQNITTEFSNLTQTPELEENLNINIITKTDLLNLGDNDTRSDAIGVTTTTISTTRKSEDVVPIEDDTNLVNGTDKLDSDNGKDDVDEKSNEEDDEEEGENIKLSESNIRENSQIGNFQNGNVIRGFGKTGTKLITPYRSDLNNEKLDDIKFTKRPVTEPNIIIRTRKIIRKINTTEPPGDDAANKKIRKVVRRLRPTTSPLNQIENNQDKAKENSTNRGYLSRRRFGFNRQSTSTTEANDEAHINRDEQEIKEKTESVSKPSFSKRRYSSFNRKTISEPIAKSKFIGTKPEKSVINKSIYNRPRFTTTTTTSTTTPATTTTSSTTELSLITDNEDNTTNDDQTSPSFLTSTPTTEIPTSEGLEITTEYDKDFSKYTSTKNTEGEVLSESTTMLSQTSTTYESKSIEDSFDEDDIRYGTQSNKKYLFDDIQIKNVVESGDSMYSDKKEYGVGNVSENEAKTTDFELAKSTTPIGITEDVVTTDEFIKSTVPTTIVEESSDATNSDELTTLYENTEEIDITTNATTIITTTPTTTTTTRRITSTTESALSRLLKRRRFGLSTNTPESQRVTNDDTEDQNQFSLLNTRLKDRKFGKPGVESTFKATENETLSISDLVDDVKVEQKDKTISEISFIENTNLSKSTLQDDTEIEQKYETEVTEEPSNASSENVDISNDSTISTESTNVQTTDIETGNTDTSSDRTGNVETQTDVPENTVSFSENDYKEQQSTEAIATEIFASTDSTIEDTFKDLLVTTEALLVTATEEYASISNVSTTSDSIITTTASTTEDTTYNDTIPTAETTIAPTTLLTTTRATTRRPNRLFRPIGARPKYTVKYRPSENTSPSTALDSSTKSYSRYKFKTKNRSRFTFSSTTARYDENEELGYGPVKEFKSILRVNSDVNEKNEYYESKVEEEEEYKNEYEDGEEEEEVEEIKEEKEIASASIRPSLYVRPYPYKPISPVIQKPSTTAAPVAEEYVEYDDDNVEDDVQDIVSSKVEDDQLDSDEPEDDAKESILITKSKQKSTTKTYRGFKSTTPANVAQNLSDINITAINQRNKNLFNKTRKMNTPVGASASSSKSKETLYAEVAHNTSGYNTPYYQNSLYSTIPHNSSYNTPYYQSSIPTSTEGLYTNIASNATYGTGNASWHSLSFFQNNEYNTTTKAYTSPTPDIHNSSVEQSNSIQTTEKSTTLLHIFAETEIPASETTLANNETDSSAAGNKKLEKLIEISRVIEVYSKEDVKNRTGIIGSKTVLKTVPIIDKIGSVSRITEIKVVEGENDTMTNDTHRQEKKYEGQPKNDFNLKIPIVTSSDITQINQIHVDNSLEVNKATPRPFYKVETSTIPLEGLFQTESALKYHHNVKYDSPNEILEGEHSRYVNVRILEQDVSDPNAKRNFEAKFVPIKILRNEVFTMKADVVEVTPANTHETIKIAPIEVSVQRKP